MLCAILDELDQSGWECVMTTRFTRDDESRDCKYEYEGDRVRADDTSGYLVFRKSSGWTTVQGD